MRSVKPETAAVLAAEADRSVLTAVGCTSVCVIDARWCVRTTRRSGAAVKCQPDQTARRRVPKGPKGPPKPASRAKTCLDRLRSDRALRVQLGSPPFFLRVCRAELVHATVSDFIVLFLPVESHMQILRRALCVSKILHTFQDHSTTRVRSQSANNISHKGKASSHATEVARAHSHCERLGTKNIGESTGAEIEIFAQFRRSHGRGSSNGSVK